MAILRQTWLGCLRLATMASTACSKEVESLSSLSHHHLKAPKVVSRFQSYPHCPFRSLSSTMVRKFFVDCTNRWNFRHVADRCHISSNSSQTKICSSTV